MMHNTGIKPGSADTATGALSVTGPQPVWMTLDEARERAFTGEVVFEVDPEVLAYLDNGVVYYAERTSDAPLGRRLLDAGVVDASQLERGTVRVGDVEHLGRLFDREPSVDRDAVLVVTETATEDLISHLANAAVATVRVTAYRHHPSGIHRWFVAQLESPASLRPVGSSNQLDSTVIEELPALSVIPDDELRIEWDDIDEVLLAPEPESATDDFEPVLDAAAPDHGEPLVDVPAPMADEPEMIEIEFGGHAAADGTDLAEEPTADESDGDATSFVDVAPSDDIAPVHVDAFDDDFEYQVTWPDGTAEPVEAEASEPTEDSVITEIDDGELHFEMPELEVSDDDAIADDVPDDVADAVRRAIAAIESASVDSSSVPVAELASDEPVVVDTFDADLGLAADTDADSRADTEITTQVEALAPPEDVEPAPAPAGMGAFAPPTMDMRAEVMYARAEEAAGEPVASSVEPSLPTPGVASVVFVDDEPEEDSGNERTSALRRLIGSLRRKDH